MGKGIKVLRICSWILLALAGYACFALETVYCSTAFEVLICVICQCGPVLFLLAGLILSIPRRTSFHVASLGMVIAAGAAYCLQLPGKDILVSYIPIPKLFPFNLMPDQFLFEYLSIASFSKRISLWIAPLYHPLYLLGLFLLILAMIMTLVQSRKRRTALSA